MVSKFITSIIFCFLASASPTLATPADDREYDAAMSNGHALQTHRQFRDAYRCFDQARRLKPDRWQPYDGAGAALIALDDCHGAMEILNRGLKVDPKQADLYCQLGQAHFWLSDPKAALVEFNRAVALQPNSMVYLGKRAESYESIGDHAHAIQDYTAAIAACAPVKATRTTPAKHQDSGIFRLASERGTIYQRTGKLQNAIDDYTFYLSAPIRQRGNALRMLQDRAECYDKLGKHELAAKDRSAAANHKGDVLEDLMHDETLGAGR
ncbi:MAG TPA: hypothetical protein V6C81_25940 [Planktothrix sp.]